MDNKDSIKLVAKLEELSEQQTLLLKGILEINGSPFHPELVLDVFKLAESCQSSDELFIFTCECSEPMCAGIDYGIHVEHLPDAVVWRFIEPLSYRNYRDLRDEEWEAMKQPVELRFDPEHYQSNIAAGINKLKALAISSEQTVELPLMEVRLERLFALQTLVFSTRMNVPEKRLIARNIEIDANINTICVNGIYYRLGALLLPPSLFSTYCAWTKYRIIPKDETGLPAYQLYLQKGREFCRGLSEYLGHEATIKLKYNPPKLYNSVAWEVIEKIG